MGFVANAVGTPAEQSLRAFLQAHEAGRRFRLVLPEFSGPVVLSGNSVASNLSYRGNTFAERDARAASYVQSLLDRIVDAGNVTVEPARPEIQQQDVAFLFGSRSNCATQAALQNLHPSLFQFEFTDTWTIQCGGQRFSLPDPSTMDPASYAATDDYGVVARVQPLLGAPVFFIAGLGGRATEGCGYYFRENWQELAAKFGSADFAVVLRFPAPFDLARIECVASAVVADIATA